jgi:predicted glycosyltransferase
MRKKLEKIHPSAVIMRGAYGRFQMGVTQACHELMIPVIEIQHGLIYENGFAYIKQTRSENHDCVPDMLFTWGDYFSEIVKKGYLFDKEKIHSVGFPYLEKMVAVEYQPDMDIVGFCKKFKRMVLVFGQTSDYSEDFIRSVAEKDNEIGYLYKAHPRDERKIIFNTHNILIVSRDVDIYCLFQYVDFTFNKSSTLMFESLAFGVPVICVSTSSFDIKKMNIVDNESVYLVDTEDEFLDVLRNTKKHDDVKKKAESFFKKNALINIKEIILEEGV